MANTVDIILRGVDKASNEIKNVNKEMGRLDKASQKLRVNFKALATGMGVAITAVGTLGVAAKKAFEFAEQGAELQLTIDRFNQLSKTIGVTSDVLAQDLQKAMGGIVSRTEALTLGTNLLSLGLVKSRNDYKLAVRHSLSRSLRKNRKDDRLI